MADFETTTDADDCRVWAWGSVDILDDPEYDKVRLGVDLESYIDYVSSVNSYSYFHNLRFDGMFILDYLLNNGYEHITDDSMFEDGTFKTLISDMGIFYSINVRWKNGYRTEFRDSLKKIPMPVRRIAKAFNLETTKGEIDYEAYRAPGQPLSAVDEDYLRRDIVIPAKAMKEILEAGMKKLTVASDSMNEYKNLVSDKWFKYRFPVLSEGMDREIRLAYRGGFTYADERFKGRVVGSGMVFDVNSLYPSVMASTLLPYGEPEFVRGQVKTNKNFPLAVFCVTMTAKLKPGHIPCIQIKGNNMFNGTEYLTEINDPTTIYVTSVDWELYNEHYDIDVLSYGGGWLFRGAVGMFDKYVDKWSEIKANSVGGKREIAKLHLNSLYGKFASNPNVTGKIPVLKNGVVKLVKGEPETRKPVYTAVGAFITAYARDVTIRAAQSNYATFAYADTDSLHLLQDAVPDNIDVHPNRLGAWKHEYSFDAAYYIRAKAYMERKTTGEYENRIAGLPTSVSSQLTFDDLREGLVLHGKLTPKTVPGGVVLKDTPYELKLR